METKIQDCILTGMNGHLDNNFQHVYLFIWRNMPDIFHSSDHLLEMIYTLFTCCTDENKHHICNPYVNMLGPIGSYFICSLLVIWEEEHCRRTLLCVGDKDSSSAAMCWVKETECTDMGQTGTSSSQTCNMQGRPCLGGSTFGAKFLCIFSLVSPD